MEHHTVHGAPSAAVRPMPAAEGQDAIYKLASQYGSDTQVLHGTFDAGGYDAPAYSASKMYEHDNAATKA